MNTYNNNFYYDDNSKLNRKEFIKALDHEQQNIAFGIISKYFAKRIIKRLIDNLQGEALKENYRLEHAGSMGMYNLLKDKLNGRLT